MNKKNIVIGIISLGFMIGSNFTAAKSSLTNRYDLPSGELVIVKGNVLSTKKINCQVRSEASGSNTLTFVSLHNQNIVNGLILPEGENTSIVAHIGDHVFLEMEANAELGITNTGESLVNIACN